ncbi:MAG TPA: HAMP domain-containing sensor histidine kinase [Devosia sp.]|nr:HAMP domain-containing sensor histidine kinase [Devosia sp.]
MPRVSILSGSAFRSAMLVLVVFALVLAVAGWAILDATRSALLEQTKSYILEDVDLLHDANTTGGERELIRFIENAVATRSDKQFGFGLFETGGRRIAGNVAKLPAFRDWGDLDRQPDQADDDPAFLAYSEKLGNRIIVVARSQRTGSAIIDSILNALIFSGIVICASAVLIGYILSRNVSSKLQVIDQTLDEVSRGNTEIRLPVGRSNDQIDHVSRQINAHLDRLSEFMGNMRNTIVAIAHDLKSPLNRAYILLQDASRARDPSEASSLLEDASNEMDSLGQIMDTVLRISRIEATDDSSTFDSFSASVLVKDLAQTFEPVLEAVGQTLRCTMTPDDVPLFGDRRMVQQMLVNLIENASRYGGATATIDLMVETRSKAPVLIVADNGKGIPADKYDDVLQPFFRIASDRTAPGAGLGLALVKAVAVRHRARLELGDNHPGLKVAISFPPAPAVPHRRELAPRKAPAGRSFEGTPLQH